MIHHYHPAIELRTHLRRSTMPTSEYTLPAMPRTFGFELETSVTQSRHQQDLLTIDHRSHVNWGTFTDELTTTFGDLYYFCHDGSIGDGFETISHPCELGHFMYDQHLKHMLKMYKKAGLLGEQSGECGLHVHVGRAQLGATKREQKLVAAKLAILGEHLNTELVQFSRRTPDQLDWCRPYSLGITSRTSESNILAICDDKWTPTVHLARYTAVNLQPKATVEFRVFNSTLDRDTLIACIQLVDNWCEYAINHTVAECLSATWADVTNPSKYKELAKVNAARGL